MPKFGELIATDVWEAAARTLTDISAEEIFDLPAFDDNYISTGCSSSGTADTYGSWVEYSADIGAGKRLIGVVVKENSGATPAPGELEIGEGESGSEVAVARIVFVGDSWRVLIFPLWKALTDNARIAIRSKDDAAAAQNLNVVLLVA